MEVSLTNGIVKKTVWILFGVLATGVGIYPLIYFLVPRTFGLLASKSADLLANPVWNASFYVHILLGGLALLIGWTQFIPGIRNKRVHVHRFIGKIYVIAALTSSLAGLYIAYYATGGWVAMTGFSFLAVFWFTSTLMAYLAIRKRQLVVHEKWMIFSYAFCFAAVTLRLWLPLLENGFGAFLPAYRMVAWLCWVPNLMVALWLTRKM